MEARTEIKSFQVDIICDKCKEGIMEKIDPPILTFPMQYKYKCPICGYEEISLTKYPYIEYEKISKEENKDGK